MRKEYDLKKLKKRPKKSVATSDATKLQINLRLDGSDLALLRDEADRLGLPYQTLIGSVIHQFVTGELVEKKTVQLIQKLKAVS